MPMENEGYVFQNEIIRDPEDCVKPVNEIDINNLRELHAATTQGEWASDGDAEFGYFYIWSDGKSLCIQIGCGRSPTCHEPAIAKSKSNSIFIAAAHNIWPALLDELERLRACKIDGMTVDDLDRLRQMLVDATATRADFEKALNASEERVAELLRENAKLEGWKRSAIETFARWDKCHVAAGSPAKPGEYTSEATEREILKLRALEHGMHCGEKSIVGLLAENERLQQQVVELNARLDTEKRAAISIAVAALDTGCVKPKSKGTVEAVNDMADEIERLRDMNEMLVGALRVASADCDKLREELKGKA